MECNAIFVYGTLQPREINHHHFKPFQGKWKNGYVLGDLETKGWGAEYGFPGIRLNPKGRQVNGSLFLSDDIADILRLLDALEGEEYQRVITDVYLEDNTILPAFIYQLAPVTKL